MSLLFKEVEFTCSAGGHKWPIKQKLEKFRFTRPRQNTRTMSLSCLIYMMGPPTVSIHTENQNQVSFHSFVLHKISVLNELTLGHLGYHLTDLRPQPNSQPDGVLGLDPPVRRRELSPERGPCGLLPLHSISEKTIRRVLCVSPAHCCSHVFYTSHCLFTRSD
ncbi:unnamed protein product [Porites lobata]|uniref:Uncharacterized protein n=1 Tax=Porites lobata TaxID=104759 RepID=A0ABN8NKB1_9CNID|nr:unnamed protein product [Porites lobata]